MSVVPTNSFRLDWLFHHFPVRSAHFRYTGSGVPAERILAPRRNRLAVLSLSSFHTV